MKHIVFILSNYLPEASSTSLCAINVIKELQKTNDYKITCICNTKGKDETINDSGIDVFKYNYLPWGDKYNNKINKVSKFIFRLKRVINNLFKLSNYPDMDNDRSKLYNESLKNLNNKLNIDCIIAVSHPHSSISAAIKFKTSHPSVKIIGYYLDTLRCNKPEFLNSKIHEWLCDYSEARIFSKLDRVVLMQYIKDKYDKPKFKNLKSKINFLNLPSLKIFKPICNNNQNLCFIGSTYSSIRNPIFAIKVFGEVAKVLPQVFFNIYGKTDMKKEMEYFSKEYPNSFRYNGFINQDHINDIYDKHDFIVNIANLKKGEVPGKTFEIIGRGKPIIHFTDIINDSSLEALMQYKNICVIDTKKGLEKAVIQVIDFITRPYCCVTVEELLNQYATATPHQMTEVIKEVIKD